MLNFLERSFSAAALVGDQPANSRVGEYMSIVETETGGSRI